MNELPPYLLVTIDTEGDRTSKFLMASPLTFDAVVEAVPRRLQPLFADFGIRPTYLLSPEVMTHPESCAVLREACDVELGTHLHGDFIVPETRSWDIAGSITGDMQWEYPPELERAKLAVLTELFIQQFGFAPTSFRAGRFGAGHHTAGFLRELGYVVDSSVTPHIRWRSWHGKEWPDFRRCDEMPYTVGSRGDIWRHGKDDFLELPITILPAGNTLGAKSSEPVWFRPSHSDLDTLINVVDHVLEQPSRRGVHRPLVMMFHNVELVPGASPYCESKDDVARYLDKLKRVFEHAEKRGVRPCTMTEYHRYYRAAREPGFANPGLTRFWRRGKPRETTEGTADLSPFDR